MNDWSNKFIHHRFLFCCQIWVHSEDCRTIAWSCAELHCSGHKRRHSWSSRGVYVRSPKPTDSRHWIRSLDEKMAIPRRTNQMHFHLPYRFEVNQFVYIKNFPRLTNDSFISYIFCLSTGLWSRHLSEYPPVVANCMYNSSHINW